MKVKRLFDIIVNMTLTTHAVAGAALAAAMPNHPISAFTAGFLSHFVLDAIPHWGYGLKSKKEDKENPINEDMILGWNFVADLFKIGFDFLIGIFIAVVFFVLYLKNSIFLISCGIVGAVLPDVLQFVQMKFRHEPLNILRRFHMWLQSGPNLDNRPFWGVLSQIMLICIILIVSLF